LHIASGRKELAERNIPTEKTNNITVVDKAYSAGLS
jgi:hypothetical protein|tara:strand:+ start:56 stop:163 length:108 start_codon:yes stop_codon:yes gene_type:complete